MTKACYPKILKKSMDQLIHNAKTAGGDMSPAMVSETMGLGGRMGENVQMKKARYINYIAEKI